MDLIVVSENAWMALQQACSTICIAWIEQALGSGLSHSLYHSSLAAVICHYVYLIQRCEVGEVTKAAAIIEQHPSSQFLVKGR